MVSFFKENYIYYKPVDEKDLSDIYAVEFYVFFDTDFKDVSYMVENNRSRFDWIIKLSFGLLKEYFQAGI